MSKYKVLLNLNHDNVEYPIGSTIEIEGSEAKQLEADGVIESANKVEPKPVPTPRASAAKPLTEKEKKAAEEKEAKEKKEADKLAKEAEEAEKKANKKGMHFVTQADLDKYQELVDEGIEVGDEVALDDMPEEKDEL